MQRKLNPNISVDVVILAVEEQNLKVLLVDRQLDTTSEDNGTIKDMKLPGGLVYNDELLIDASRRILLDHTGVNGIKLEQFNVLDSLERMQDEKDKKWLEQITGMKIDRVISIAFFGIINLDEMEDIQLHENAHFTSIKQAQNLPFDHAEIINNALLKVREGMKRDALVFDLLPEKFTITQLKSVLEIFYDTELDSRNFRKKLKKLDYIIPLDEKQMNVPHKPALLYKFDENKFSEFNNDRLTF